ncbi:MAG: cupin domain-containing protein [Gammaproteobacteria bacterium]|nr:cupin domain-containing protein [Gammaproteobacteria bacterium]
MLYSVLPEDFNAEIFLRDYWQKKPLLIRAGGASFVDLIEPEELAGLACEEGVESRLVQVNAAQNDWTLREGPFTEQDFLDLPETHYSLLVQAVDQWVDDVAALLSDFDFIPGWRIDDVMISYATDQGNVGPHFDYYDVFLIQGSGQKRWQTGAMCNSLTPRRDDSGLKLLESFKPEQEWIVNPGDILYLPPGLSHYGVAIGNSITYSVGFRAPSHADILSGVLDSVLDTLVEDQRFTDAAPRMPVHPGEITADVVENLQALIRSLMLEPTRIRQWFGRTMTTPKYPVLDDAPCCDHDHDHDHDHDNHAITINDIADLRKALANGAGIYKVPGARFAYAVSDNQAELYADGELYLCDLRLLTLFQALSTPGHVDEINADVIDACLPDNEAAGLLLKLYQDGSLVVG